MILSAYQNYGGNYGVHHAGAMKPDPKTAESTSQTRNEGDQVILSDEAHLSTSKGVWLTRGTALVN